MTPPRWQADVALAIVSFIWGSTFVLVKNALDDVSTLLFVTLRFAFAAAVLGSFWLARRARNRTGTAGWGGGLVAGFFLYAGYVLQTAGLRYTTPAKSGFITGLYIVLVPLLSAGVYRKIPGVGEWLGVLLATIGLGLLSLDTSNLQIGIGDLLTVGCAVAFAVHILVLGRIAADMDPDWLSFLQIATCAALGLNSFWWMEAPFVRWTVGVVTAVLVTALLATALAFWMQTWAQRHTTATRAAMIFSLEPVFAWFTAFLLTGEKLHSQALTGAVCILAGILLVELKPTGWRSHQPS